MAENTDTGWNPKVDPLPSSPTPPPTWPGPPVYPPPPTWGAPPPPAPPSDWSAPPPPPPLDGAPPTPPPPAPDASAFRPAPAQPAVDGWGMPITQSNQPHPTSAYPPPPAYPPPGGPQWIPYGSAMPSQSPSARKVVRGGLWIIVATLWMFVALGALGAASGPSSPDYTTGDVVIGLAFFAVIAGGGTLALILTRKPRR